MKLFAYGVCICMTLSYSFSFAQTSALAGGPDKLTLLYLLRAGAYDPLMLELKNVSETMRKDKTREGYYWQAFKAFEDPDPSIEPKLDEWIKLNPGCADAYAARAGYYMRTGWNVRGYGWAKDVAQEQWGKMAEYFRKAAKDALQGLKLDPQNLYCYDVLISIGMSIGRKDVTQQVFQKALTVDPGSLEIWVSYIWSLLPRWGGSHREMQEVVDESRQYLGVNPRLKVLGGFLPFDEGWALEDRGDYQSAIRDYSRAISFGAWQDFYYQRAMCYYNLDEYGPALVDVERALKLSPQNTDYMCLEAEAMLALGNAGEARSVMEDAVKINPADKSVQETEAYVGGKKANGLGHSIVGYDLLKQGEYYQAIKEFTLAVDSDATDYTSYYDRGICYVKLRQYIRAIADFQRVAQLRPGDSGAYEHLGWIYLQQEKYEDAILENTQAIEVNPQSSIAYFNRAVCYFRLGKKAEALADLKRSCELGYQDACKRYDEAVGQQ